MTTAKIKIEKMLELNGSLALQISTIKHKNQLIDFLSKEARRVSIRITKKEIKSLIDEPVSSSYQAVPNLKILGPACFNSSPDSDEENGGTSCITSC